MISAPRKGYPADKAGLKEGDVILKVGDIDILDRADFERALIGKKAGEKIEVKYKRADEELVAELEINAFDPQSVVRVKSSSVIRGNNDDEAETKLEDRIWDELGVKLQPLPPDQTVTRRTVYESGLRVISVKPASTSARAGIQPGDVIVGLHRWATVSIDNVKFVIDQSEVKQNNSLRFYIIRGTEVLRGELKLK